MKILFLGLRFPYPPHRGDKIRSYNFIKHLAAKHSLSAVFFSESDDEIHAIKHIKPYCDLVKLVPFHKNIARLNSILHSLSTKPLQIWYWYSHKMQRIIGELVDQHDFDIIHVQFFRMARYVTQLAPCPKVLDLGDAMSLNLHRRATLDKSIAWPMVKLEELRVRRYETEILKDFDVGTMVSAFDRDYLLSLDNSLNLEVVPMGVDLEYFQPNNAQSRAQLLFTGTMNYFPNYDAVCYFYHQIFPYIKQTHPDVIFYVVGNYPPPKLKRLESNRDIVVTGHVPDTRPYFAQAAVFVSSLRGGSGIQVKNLEAMAMGVPVVTTSVGAAGIEAKIGAAGNMSSTLAEDVNLIVADEPKEFAAKVIQLLDDPIRRRQIGQNGRGLVEQKYNWPDVVRRLDKIYEQIVRKSPSCRKGL